MTFALKFYRLDEDAIIPKKNHVEDAAFDLCFTDKAPVAIGPGEQYIFPTGLAGIIPDGYWVQFRERSGLASKQGIKLSAGVIDSGYTGEWKVILLNTTKDYQVIYPGTAICQFTIEKINPVTDIFVMSKEEYEYEASKKVRGTKGFGSSDVKK